MLIAGCCHPPMRTPTEGVKVINMIPFSMSSEINQDSEPFLAVDLSDTNRMVGTAFTPNPFGSSGNAPVYVTTDGGETWSLNFIVDSHGFAGTNDITVAGTMTPLRLHGSILRSPGSLLMNVLRTNNFTTPAVMGVLQSRTNVDQPFVQATTWAGTDRIYVGNNDFNAGGGKTATVDVSTDGGATFPTIRLEPRNTNSQNGPSVRPAVSGDGTVYVAYFGWRGFVNNTATSDIVVVRDDHGAMGANPFRDLLDPSDNLPGRKVATNVRIPWSNAPTLGNERIGSTLSLAVHPTNSNIVYVCWADRVGGETYTLHVRRSTDRGVTWSGDLRTVKNATCGALAVAPNGTVGFLYQQFVTDCRGFWATHLEQSSDGFQTKEEVILSYTPNATPEPKFLPYLGDYNFLFCVGNEFRGVFSASNAPVLDIFRAACGINATWISTPKNF
ncbi:MAG: hypothetical protein C4326_07485 [Ignavibacteria bacterium]